MLAPVHRIVFALCALCTAGTARAQETAPTTTSSAAPPNGDVRLVYSPGPFAPRCPAIDEVRAAISARLGYDPFREPAARIVLILLDGPSESSEPTRARVELLNMDMHTLGTRQIESGEGCRELLATAALQASIAVDPVSVSAAAGAPPTEPQPPPPQEQPPPPQENVEATTTPTPAPLATPPAAPPEAAPAKPQLALLLGGHTALLLAPQPFAAGLLVGVEGVLAPWSLRLELRGDIPIGDKNGARATPILATVAPCARLPLGSGDGDITLLGCGTVTGGAVPVFGPMTAVAPYFGGGGRAGMGVRLADGGRVDVFAQLEAGIIRPAFILPSGSALTTAPVNVLLGVAASLPFQGQ